MTFLHRCLLSGLLPPELVELSLLPLNFGLLRRQLSLDLLVLSFPRLHLVADQGAAESIKARPKTARAGVKKFAFMSLLPRIKLAGPSRPYLTRSQRISPTHRNGALAGNTFYRGSAAR
jgi:hypothetical protein